MAAPPKPGAGIPTPALDEHPHHRADLLEGFLARGAPGGGAVVEQRRAVRVPRPLGRLDHHREREGAAFFVAHGTNLAGIPVPCRPGAGLGHHGEGDAASFERTANVPPLPTGSSSARWITRAEAYSPDSFTRGRLPPCRAEGHGLRSPGSALEDEGHLHVDLVLGDLAVLELDALVLDPGRGDAAQGLGGALQALTDGVLEALRRGGGDFAHACDGHGSLPDWQ